MSARRFPRDPPALAGSFPGFEGGAAARDAVAGGGGAAAAAGGALSPPPPSGSYLSSTLGSNPSACIFIATAPFGMCILSMRKNLSYSSGQESAACSAACSAAAGVEASDKGSAQAVALEELFDVVDEGVAFEDLRRMFEDRTGWPRFALARRVDADGAAPPAPPPSAANPPCVLLNRPVHTAPPLAAATPFVGGEDVVHLEEVSQVWVGVVFGELCDAVHEQELLPVRLQQGPPRLDEVDVELVERHAPLWGKRRVLELPPQLALQALVQANEVAEPVPHAPLQRRLLLHFVRGQPQLANHLVFCKRASRVTPARQSGTARLLFQNLVVFGWRAESDDLAEQVCVGDDLFGLTERERCEVLLVDSEDSIVELDAPMCLNGSKFSVP
eukprot:CAMPEP_0171886906 /NCGR_PEP_ID=MMETSP0992-20121227/42154_1 /TAXON_ID=483369 /ORGANISM="non described non described, Strain CCMP2098" /LENGTH=386 /DNA_ID=CAMNT_0012513603 /DNA_START=137 /DNA_END=1297 /DNA_ORIENTATION=+